MALDASTFRLGQLRISVLIGSPDGTQAQIISVDRYGKTEVLPLMEAIKQGKVNTHMDERNIVPNR